MSQLPEYSGRGRNLSELKAWAKQRHERALEPELPIVDVHHHVWEDQRGRYLIPELLEDIYSGHNIIATMLVEAESMYRTNGPIAMRPVGEVEFYNGVAAMSASGQYGKCCLGAGIVGWAELMLGDEVQPVLEALVAAGNGRLRGIRYGLAWDSGEARSGKRQIPRYLALDATFRKGLAHVEQLGLSIDLRLFYPQLPDLMDLLHAFPNINATLTHAGGILGIPPHDGKRKEIFAIWRDHMRALARFPNLSIKVGAFGMPCCGWDFHLRDLPPSSEELATAWRPYVETCIEAFGPPRCMMESNFPTDKQSCGYGELWNAFKRITQAYSATEKTALYYETATRIYRLAV